MRVKMIGTGLTVEVSETYAKRLYEQGACVYVDETAEPEPEKKPAKKKAAEKNEAGEAM